MKSNSLVPELDVKDIEKSLEFYCNVLGFKIEYQRKESKFAFLSFEDSQIMIEEVNGYWKTGELSYPFGRGINFQIKVSNVDKILKELKKIKYPLFREVEENWYRKDNTLKGCKEFLVQDPDGYLLRFSESLGEKKI